MGVFAVIFGLCSLNVIVMLNANFALIATHGAMALFDGALVQLLELLIFGYLAVVFYVLFKACESVLVGRIFAR
jgi:hypothetical protein